jgi:hypothetical protein
MNFQDTYKELVELTNSSDALMVHRAMRAVNRSLSWMLNQHDFLYNETSASVTIGTSGTVTLPTDFAKLVSACYASEGKQIPVVTYSLFRARKALYEQRTTATLSDPSYFEDFVSDQNGMWLVQRGQVLEAFPVPTVDTQVSLYYQKDFTPLAATTDTNFLLSAFPDTVMLKAITSTFRAYLRQDVASSFPAELFLAEWNAVIAWDTSLRSNFNQLS